MKQSHNKKFHRFILIDGDLVALANAERIIRKKGRRTEIISFCAAKEAIEYMDTEDFMREDTVTVFLTDLHLLDSDSFALLDHMENTYKIMRDRLHFFVLAAAACPGEIKRVLSYSFVIGFLSKPFSNDKIGQIIDCIQYPL